MTDQELIDVWLRLHNGPTKCPTAFAYALGESTPGWRRTRERIARFSSTIRQEAREATQSRIAPELLSTL